MPDSRPQSSDFRAIGYGRQSIDGGDISAVVEVLRSDWLTTGPKVEEFERVFARFCGARHAVAVSSGTAALHCSVYAAGIGPGDEVIVSPMTFAASANCVLYCGGTPVFADVEPETLLIDPAETARKVTERTKAIIAVDYAGQPCNYDALRAVAEKYGLTLIADACHAVGGFYKGRPVGSLAHMSAFSFHPVKNMTTGEGGMITTDNTNYADRMRSFRNHGIATDYRQRETMGSWFYEMVDLGFNYRITDMQCALGISQLKKLPDWIARRRCIAAKYDDAFAKVSGVTPLGLRADVIPPSGNSDTPTLRHSETSSVHAYHLYVIRVSGDRTAIFRRLREAGIGVNVHYIPVHFHPYYREHLGTGPGLCPVAEAAYEGILSLPMFPGLSNADVERVITEVKRAVCKKKTSSAHYP